MKKLLSLTLASCLLFNSVTPAFAQNNQTRNRCDVQAMLRNYKDSQWLQADCLDIVFSYWANLPQDKQTEFYKLWANVSNFVLEPYVQKLLQKGEKEKALALSMRTRNSPFPVERSVKFSNTGEYQATSGKRARGEVSLPYEDNSFDFCFGPQNGKERLQSIIERLSEMPLPELEQAINALSLAVANPEDKDYVHPLVLNSAFVFFAQKLSAKEKHKIVNFLGERYENSVRWAAANSLAVYAKEDDNINGKFVLSAEEFQQIKEIYASSLTNSCAFMAIAIPVQPAGLEKLAAGAVGSTGIVLAVIGGVAFVYYAVTEPFWPAMIKAVVSSEVKFLHDLLDETTPMVQYAYSSDIPAGVMYFVRWVDAIEISRADAGVWTVSMDRNNRQRVTCKGNLSLPQGNECATNPQCVKSEYKLTEAKMVAGYQSEPLFINALKYEDKIASTKQPDTPIVWHIVHEPAAGGWVPYGEVPMRVEDAGRDIIKITTQFTEDEVYNFLGDILEGKGVLQTADGTTLRIGKDEVQGGRRAHIHFEEIQRFADGQPYVCNHAVYFDVPRDGRHLVERFVDALGMLLY